ncbi:MAG: HRDC domain-containing protein [Planctomycetes bacterium]|nr:HRDC domain-containing protein [Planctomycetota bacterium]
MWLVDPLAVRDVSGLAGVMAEARIEKVLHGAEYDLTLLKRDFAFTIRSLFDTQIAAQFLGRRAFGLAPLLEGELGVRLSKTAQRCDWSLRPLTPAQVRYAAEDVRHLVGLRDKLLDELRRRGREAWVREECEALVEETLPAVRRGPADFLGARGARDLRPLELAVLKEVFALREEWARALDRPLFKVVGDEALMRIAVRQPRDAAALGPIGGLSSSVRNGHGREIVEAVRRALSLPEGERPTFPDRRGKRMTWECSRRVDRLKGWRVKAAERTGLDPGVLLPQRLIERIALADPKTREELAAVPGVRRWRAGELGEEIVSALRG